MARIVSWLSFTLFISINFTSAFAQGKSVRLNYTISFPQPARHSYEVELQCSKWDTDTIQLKMPRWMPGYYQIMDYAKSISNLSARDNQEKSIKVKQTADNSWVLAGIRNKPFRVKYTITTNRKFVANSFVDSAHAYIVPENTFLYIDGALDLPVSVRLNLNRDWKNIATGLDQVPGKTNVFTAPDFDILYDCPILAGQLQELPSFKVNGIEHRFIGYDLGKFDRELFMNQLKKLVESAAAIIGDIPYKHYTFIGIGKGRGGIEHLNNTTISFDGSELNNPGGMNRMLNFIAHEYFHHYNVKRIRPLELGPFDYEKGNKTNLLWISEGLTVYYEYLVVKRAGLADAETLLANFNGNLSAFEKNPGRYHQSLQQASFRTWSDGPFGTQGNEPGKSISYYDKGPLVGLLLDFEIRNATQNRKSLDDVMRTLYWKYYKEKNRGFTEAEFQAVCEEVSAAPLTALFEYVYTTKELDYAKYLAYAGLKINKANDQKLVITRADNPTQLQEAIFKSWLGELY